jgi:predicted amidohydrolase YtcJ
MAPSKLFYNGRIFTQSDTGQDGPVTFVDSMLVQGTKIMAIGHRGIADGIEELEAHDMKQRVILPSFMDGHMHLLLLGQSLRKVDLTKCNNLDEIKATIKSFAVANPDVGSILCKGWMHFMTPNGVTATMLDDIDPRPIFIDASSLHSCWCNSSALKVLGLAGMPDPAGGTIYRDAQGNPSGLVDEGAMMSIIWPFQAKSSPKEERIAAIRAAICEYNIAGYTGLVEMAMDEEAWDALVTLMVEEPDLAIRIAAYWLIKPEGWLESVKGKS